MCLLKLVFCYIQSIYEKFLDWFALRLQKSLRQPKNGWAIAFALQLWKKISTGILGEKYPVWSQAVSNLDFSFKVTKAKDHYVAYNMRALNPATDFSCGFFFNYLIWFSSTGNNQVSPQTLWRVKFPAGQGEKCVENCKRLKIAVKK